MMKSKKKLFLVLLLVLLAAGSLVAAPRLTIPEATFDFGFVPQNSKISHDFWLESTGDDTLKILKVVPG
jgi:ABC-type nitrate/sulfonate/bicarbonate transport system substrate-binding protein